MSQTTAGATDIEGLELTESEYTVQQGFIRNKYKAMEPDGDVVLRGKQKMFKLKEEFPFVDADDNEVFTVKAGGIIDIAGDYMLKDAETEEELVILDNDYSIFQDTWRIRDPTDESIIAKIDSRGAAVTLARNVIPFGFIIPHKYEITDVDGDHVGTIDGAISLKDRYSITIDDASDVPKEPVVAAAMVIDAIQGN